MATSKFRNQEHKYAPNPRFQENVDWVDVYPKIEHDGMYLRNKYTGEIVPNNGEYPYRSDILEAISDEKAHEILGIKLEADGSVAKQTSTMGSL